MKPAVLLLALVAIASPVRAEDQRMLGVASAAFLQAATADNLLTIGCLYRVPECHETDPLLAWSQPKPAGLFVLASAMDVASLWAFRRVVGRHHPRIATAILIGVSAYRVHLAVRSARYLQGPR